MSGFSRLGEESSGGGAFLCVVFSFDKVMGSLISCMFLFLW